MHRWSNRCFVANDCRFRHSRIGVQDALNVFGINIEAFRSYDHFLLSAPQLQIALFIKNTDITRVQPSFLKYLRSGFFIVIVSGADIWSADKHFSVFRNLHFESGEFLTDRTLFDSFEWMGDRDRWRCFRQTVALDYCVSQRAPKLFLF